MAFGKEIKRLREKEKLSVSKLAAMIGVNAYRLRKWEEKDFDPRYDDVQLIEKFFQTPIDNIKNLPSLKPYLKVQYSYKDEMKELEEPDYKDKYIKLLERQNEMNLTEIKELLTANQDMLGAIYEKLLPEAQKDKTSAELPRKSPKKEG